jgi:hypothetical protein
MRLRAVNTVFIKSLRPSNHCRRAHDRLVVRRVIAAQQDSSLSWERRCLENGDQAS